MDFAALRDKAKKRKHGGHVEGGAAKGRLDRKARGGSIRSDFNAAIHDQPARPTIDEPSALPAVHARKDGGHIPSKGWVDGEPRKHGGKALRREAGGAEINNDRASSSAAADVKRDADDVSSYRDENVSRWSTGNKSAPVEPVARVPLPASSSSKSPASAPKPSTSRRENGTTADQPRYPRAEPAPDFADPTSEFVRPTRGARARMGVSLPGDVERKHGGKWIAGAIKHPGALHRALHVPAGEKIPAKKLTKAEHSDNPKLRKEANLAKTLKGFHH